MKKRKKTTRSLTTFVAPFTQGNGNETMTLTCRIPSRKSTNVYSSRSSIDKSSKKAENKVNRRIQLSSLSRENSNEKKSLELSLGSFRNRAGPNLNLCKIVVSQKRKKSFRPKSGKKSSLGLGGGLQEPSLESEKFGKLDNLSSADLRVSQSG
jgi:hypothetical protein